MRGFLFFLISTLCGTAGHTQFQFVDLITSRGEHISGELVHRYEARWFWQGKGKEYWGIFQPQAKTPPIMQFIPTADIVSFHLKSQNHSLLQDYFVHRNLLMQQSPLGVPGFISTANNGHHLAENMYGDFALDFEVKKDGKNHKASNSTKENYHIWGQKVFAPMGGVVTNVISDKTDHPADPNFELSLAKRSTGNFVIIHLADGFYYGVYHLKKGSIPTKIKAGVEIRTGALLGEVGNSGLTHIPHLHLTTYYYSQEMKRLISIPNYFKSAWTRPQDKDIPKMKTIYFPEEGETLLPQKSLDLHRSAPFCQAVYAY